MLRILVVLSLFSFSSHAARHVLVMPIYMRGTIDYTKNYLGTSAPGAVNGAPYNGAYGNQVLLDIDLVNLSNLAQTGDLSFVPGTIQAGAGCSYNSGEYVFSANLQLCRYADNTGTDVQIGTSYTTSTYPTPLTFTVAANGFARLSVRLWVTGVYGTTHTTGCQSATNFYFSPKLKISVNEDKGALMASMIMGTYGMGTAGTVTNCAGRSFPGAHYDGFSPTFDPAPIPINGGRPF